MSTFDDDQKLEAIAAFNHNQILAAIATTGAVARALTPAENDAYRQALCEKFGTGRPHWRLWDSLANAVVVQDEAGWQLLDGFMPATPVILLVDDSISPCGFACASGRDIVPILGDTTHFEFSITNPELDFVLCFNFHDFLIACGTAAEWVQALIDARQE